MKQKKIKETDNMRLVMVSIIAVIFLGLAVIVNIRFRRISVTSINNGHSSDFHGRDIQDRLLPPRNEEIIEIDSEGLIMMSSLPSSSSYINYSLMYKCIQECPIFEIDYLKNNGMWQKTLISHPIFEKINWLRIRDNDGINLYQRDLKYRNIEELLNSDENYMVLEDVIDGELDSNYVISRIEPPGLLGEWRLFNQVIKVYNARVDKSNQTTFLLKTVGGGKVSVARIRGELVQ